MKVTEWTFWNDDRFESIDEMSDEEFEKAIDTIAKEIKNKGYKITGWQHQNYEHGCPVIDNKYIFCVSMRKFGEVMQKAYDLPNDDGLGYVIWAWSNPNNEKSVLPK